MKNIEKCFPTFLHKSSVFETSSTFRILFHETWDKDFKFILIESGCNYFGILQSCNFVGEFFHRENYTN